MDGILVINKPKAFSSHDVVNVVRKNLREKKVGHAGTLDPNATGVLLLLIGKGTKLSKYLIEHDKTYIATIKLGKKTNTGDSEGEIIEEKEVKILSRENIEKTIKSFKGVQMQTPPIYSAIKINGKKAYEYARKGQTVDISAREIEIYDIELLNIEKDELSIKVKCSKGTYIRTLCEDIANKLETVGYMKELERIQVNDFSINQSIELNDINSEEVEKKLITVERVFENKGKINLNKKDLQLFLNGVILRYDGNDDTYRIYSENKFLGLGIVNNNLLKRDIIL